MRFNVLAMLRLLTMWIAKAQKVVCLLFGETKYCACGGSVYFQASNYINLEEADDKPILCNNKQTVQVLQKDQPVFKTKLKHFDI